MGMGFAPTWLRQVSPLLHMTTLTTVYAAFLWTNKMMTMMMIIIIIITIIIIIIIIP